jgi:hypothetical protein
MEDRTNTYYESSSCRVAEGKKRLNKNISSPLTTFSPSKRRRVRFSDCRLIHQPSVSNEEEMKVDDDTLVLPELTWYSRQEIVESHKGVVTMIREQRKWAKLAGIRNHPSNASFRGVEDMLSSQVRQERKRRKRSVIETVLSEQSRQISLKILDAERLGRKSILASKSSRDIASRRGQLDILAAYCIS